MTPAPDTRTADWVVTGLRGFGESVLSVVPAGFPTYVRVFHPAYRGPLANPMPVRWAEIAETHAKRYHAGMQLSAVTGRIEFWNERPPTDFDWWPKMPMPRDLVMPLAAILARHTTTADRCWFATWEGYGDLPDDIRQAPIFRAGHRYHLQAGPITAVMERTTDPSYIDHSPNIWWPDDRAWCVASEIDLNSTYVACDEACAEELLSAPELEALRIDSATGIDITSDRLNPQPELDWKEKKRLQPGDSPTDASP